MNNYVITNYYRKYHLPVSVMHRSASRSAVSCSRDSALTQDNSAIRSSPSELLKHPRRARATSQPEGRSVPPDLREAIELLCTPVWRSAGRCRGRPYLFGLCSFQTIRGQKSKGPPSEQAFTLI